MPVSPPHLWMTTQNLICPGNVERPTAATAPLPLTTHPQSLVESHIYKCNPNHLLLPPPKHTCNLPEVCASCNSSQIIQGRQSIILKSVGLGKVHSHSKQVLTNFTSFSTLLSPLSPPSSLEEFHLAERDTEAHTTGLLGECSAETHTQPVQDFGQSLFAGSVTNTSTV